VGFIFFKCWYYRGVLYMRELVSLACEVCKHRNYTTDKNKKSTPSKLQLKKFCPHCGKHTLHKESSIK